jgi:hypothetical protein
MRKAIWFPSIDALIDFTDYLFDNEMYSITAERDYDRCIYRDVDISKEIITIATRYGGEEIFE